jgi:hypothetical protein
MESEGEWELEPADSYEKQHFLVTLWATHETFLDP